MKGMSDSSLDAGRESGEVRVLREGSPGLVPTFAELREYGTDLRTEEIRHDRPDINDSKLKLNIGQFVSALNRAMKESACEEGNPARDALTRHVAQLEKSSGANRKPLAEARRALKYLDALEAKRRDDAAAAPAEPDTFNRFGRELLRAINEAGYNRNEVARRMKMHPPKIYKWTYGEDLPKATRKAQKLVNAIEKLLGRKKNSLWDIAAEQHVKLWIEWPACVPNGDNTKRRLLKITGPLQGFSPSQQSKLVEQAWVTDQTRAAPAQPYGLGKFEDWPAKLQRQWWYYLDENLDKGQEIPAEDICLLDRIPHPPVLPAPKKKIYRVGKPHRVGTALCYERAINLMLGCAVNVHDLVTREEAGLELFLFPKVIECFFNFKRERDAQKRKEQGGKGEKKKVGQLSKTDVKDVCMAKRIVLYISKRPGFAKLIKAIPGLVSEREARAARADFQAACSNAITRYNEIYDHEIHDARKPRNTSEGAEGTLEADRPLKTAWQLTEQLRRRAAAMPEGSLEKAKALRDFIVIAVIEAQNALRPGTGRLLDWRADNKGNVRFLILEDGRLEWLIVAPSEYFKNGAALHMREGYTRTIENVSRVYDAIREYIRWGRAKILDGAASDAFIVWSPERPRYTPNRFGEYVTRITQKAMRKDHPEYRGTKRITPIQFRQMVSTENFNKSDGNYQVAGDSIGNTAQSAQVYVWRAAAQRSKRAEANTRESAGEHLHPKPKVRPGDLRVRGP